MTPQDVIAHSIPSGDDTPVVGDLYAPGEKETTGIVVLCHGFKGHRDWGFFPYLGERLRAAGIAALSIDFSYNGTATPRDPDAPRFARPDLFMKNTLRREYDDLGHVLEFVRGGGLGEVVDGAAPIGLFGHSRGGLIAALHSIDDGGVATLVTWATTNNPNFYTDNQREKWRRAGEFAFVDSRDGTRLSVGIDYLDDLETHADFYHLGKRIEKLRTPHLIVHGAQDLAVRIEAAYALHDAETQLEKKQLVVIEGGHTFGVDDSTVLQNPPDVLVKAAGATIRWFKTHLGDTQ